MVIQMAFYRTCPFCGCNLDPGEQCDCMEEKEVYRKRCEEFLTVHKDGQMVLKEAVAC